MVLDIDEERRRISLGVKQCKANPWKEFADNYTAATRSAANQVDHRLRYFHRLGRRHRRSGSSVGHLLGHARRGSGTQLSEGAAGRCHGAAIDPGASASASHQAIGQGSVLGLHCRASEGSIVTGVVVKWMRRARSSIWATASTVSCGFGAVSRSRRGRPPAAQSRRGSRGEVHRCGSQGAQHLAVDQGEGHPRGTRAMQNYRTDSPTGTSLEISLKSRSPAGLRGLKAARRRDAVAPALLSMSSDAHGSIMTKSELIEIISAKQKPCPRRTSNSRSSSCWNHDDRWPPASARIRGFGSFIAFPPAAAGP